MNELRIALSPKFTENKQVFHNQKLGFFIWEQSESLTTKHTWIPLLIKWQPELSFNKHDLKNEDNND